MSKVKSSDSLDIEEILEWLERDRHVEPGYSCKPCETRYGSIRRRAQSQWDERAK